MSPATRFLLGFVTGIALLIGGLGAGFLALDAADRLKAPSFANRMSFDEKLRRLRAEPIRNPEVLFIGSSTTLHGLDGAVLETILAPEGNVANLGVQDLRINQTRFLADFFLDLYGPVDQVVMVSTMLDFKDCATSESGFFDREHVRAYLEGGPEVFYQFKYFDPEGVFKRAGDIRFLRATDDRLESVSFDDYGSLLLEVPEENVNPRVMRGDPIVLDPACYEELEAMARGLRERDIGFVYVVAPMRPSYLEDRDPGGELLREHYDRLHAALDDSGAVIIDAHSALEMPEEAFFDAYHLSRDKARRFTRFVGERMIAHTDGPAPERTAGPTAGQASAGHHLAAGPQTH